MEKQFDKKQFNTKLYIMFGFWGIIMLIGIISFILSTSLKGAAYNFDPKDYYGVYAGEMYDKEISLIIDEEKAILYDIQSTENYKYTYMSATQVKEKYGKEDGRAGLFLYQEDPNYGILFWLYDDNGEYFLREKVTDCKLILISLDD